MRERDLGTALFPTATKGRDTAFSEPDFAALHGELKLKGMIKLLQGEEYRETHPNDGYSYAHFCHLFAEWQGKQKRSMRQVGVPVPSMQKMPLSNSP